MLEKYINKVIESYQNTYNDINTRIEQIVYKFAYENKCLVYGDPAYLELTDKKGAMPNSPEIFCSNKLYTNKEYDLVSGICKQSISLYSNDSYRHIPKLMQLIKNYLVKSKYSYQITRQLYAKKQTNLNVVIKIPLSNFEIYIRYIPHDYNIFKNNTMNKIYLNEKIQAIFYCDILSNLFQYSDYWETAYYRLMKIIELYPNLLRKSAIKPAKKVPDIAVKISKKIVNAEISFCFVGKIGLGLEAPNIPIEIVTNDVKKISKIIKSPEIKFSYKRMIPGHKDLYGGIWEFTHKNHGNLRIYNSDCFPIIEDKKRNIPIGSGFFILKYELLRGLYHGPHNVLIKRISDIPRCIYFSDGYGGDCRNELLKYRMKLFEQGLRYVEWRK